MILASRLGRHRPRVEDLSSGEFPYSAIGHVIRARHSNPSDTGRVPQPESYFGFRAPALDLKTRLGSDAILVGRQLLMMTLMPLMKERPDQPMDGDKLAVPFEALEHGFLHRQLLDKGRVYDDDETFPIPRLHKDAVTPEQLQALVMHTPVVIEGLVDDEMLQRWSFDHLKQHFGGATLTVTNPDLTEYKSSIGEMIDAVVAGDESGTSSHG